MAEIDNPYETGKVLNTRIQLKYDTYARWQSNNPVLKKGEIAIATIQVNEGVVQNAPSILIKVGDGTTDYNNLKFVSGLSADVYAWAKASTKPTYTASEISGLSDYISGEIQDTDTQYRIVKVDEFNFKLQSKTLSGSWTDVDGSTIPIKDFTENITLLQNKISQSESQITEINTDIGVLLDNGNDAGKSIRTISAEEVAKIVADAPEAYDTLKEIADYISSDTTRAAELSNKVNSNTTAINNLANIATSGNVNDLVQTSGDVLVLNCGDSIIGYDYIINDPEITENTGQPPITS